MITVHPDRYNNRGTLKKIAVVVHTSEGGESSLGYAGLLAAFTRPGDRPSGGGGFYGASYNAVANPGGGYTTILDDSKSPYAAPPWNEEARHIVMPGKASQTRAEWLGDISRDYIRGVAAYIVDSCREHNIPIHRLTVAEMKTAGEKPLTALGYCSHADVSLAYKKSNHTDPGPNFPWDVLASDIGALSAPPPLPIPPEEDEMPKAVITYWQPPKPGQPTGPTGYIYTDWSCWYSVTAEEQADLIRRGAVDETHGPGLSTGRTLFRAKAAV